MSSSNSRDIIQNQNDRIVVDNIYYDTLEKKKPSKKEFRDKFKVNNTILENIWDANFKKKNGYCPNCNI